jgi:hypothetical protein
MCIGQSMEPISGICPVRKGRTSARARNRAASTRFFVVVFMEVPLSCHAKRRRYSLQGYQRLHSIANKII